MINEVRIYYESYEQARHYIFPIIRKVFPKVSIKLISIQKDKLYKKSPNSRISNIFRLKVPDILISVLVNRKEFPVFLIEFSEAVTTEDHELQRFDGYLAAVVGRCYYIKISPIKLSVNEHGGNINFNILEPYALILKRFNILSFHFQWPLSSDTLVRRNDKYLSCPPEIEDFNLLITKVLSLINNNSEKIETASDIMSVIDARISKIDFVKNWIKDLKNISLDDIYSKLNSTRIKWCESYGQHKNCILFKFNRMGHEMDPERGMIWYHNLRHGKDIVCRIIFPSKGDKIFKQIDLKDDYDYLRAFMEGTGLNKGGLFVNFLIQKGYLKDNRLTVSIIDITDFINRHIGELNKALFSIFVNSRAFYILDKSENPRIILTWGNIVNIFSSSNNLEPSKLMKRDILTEDDITYIVAHQVLRPNGFKLIAISYPGAQGDRAILPEGGHGRGQKRKYIDIIATLPKKYLDLTESKGAFNKRGVSEDIENLKMYQNVEGYKLALRALVDHVDPNSKELPLIISVAFWSKLNTNFKSVPINELDFFIAISPDKKTWKIWRGGNLDIFSSLEGQVDLEDTYVVK